MIVLVEDFPCDNENQARAKEAFYIQNNPCVNKNVPGRTQKESSKASYELYKDKRNEHQKQYNDEYKDKIKEYKKKYYLNKKRMLLNINNNNAIQQIDQPI